MSGSESYFRGKGENENQVSGSLNASNARVKHVNDYSANY